MQNATIQSMHIPKNAIVICATARLSRGLQDAHQQEKISQGLLQWQAPAILTLGLWLDGLVNEGLLLGEIDAFSLPKFTLSAVAEKLLWEEAIANVLQKNEASALFDISSLAQSAIEANKLLIEWQLDESELKNTFQTEETRQFLRWRHEFQRLCSHHNTLEASRLLLLQISNLEKAQLNLPAHIIFAGYDRFTPLEKRLLQNLKEQNVSIELWQHQTNQTNQVENLITKQIALTDSDAECRAAVAWAKNTLALNPHAQLAIISHVLGNIRSKLSYLLDDTFHPETLHPSHYEAPRCYDFSLGLPLTQYPIINSAISLLKLSIPHTSLTQAICDALLQDVYFCHAGELDARAQLDARLRKKLGRTFSFSQLINQTHLAIAQGLEVTQLHQYLTQIKSLTDTWQSKQKPSAWALSFIALLETSHWSTSRDLSSYEHQTKQAWLRVLNEFTTLDLLLGNINANEALQRLTQLTHNAMFQPEAKGETHIQLLGLLETVAVQLDGIWVLGMNDNNWPPAAKPNPLLPAQLQRTNGTPNACAQVQSDFANLIHQRLIKSASTVIFSYALKDGDRELRPSPTIKEISVNTEQLSSATNKSLKTIAEILSVPATMQKLDDHIAPAVSENEKVRGGSGLLKAQAICPAWAFYQYRLSAIALEDPIDGLGSLARGTLVHAVLQCFWQDCQNLMTLKAMTSHEFEVAIESAVVAGIAQYCAEQVLVMPPQIVALEQYRLKQLLSTWLTLELDRADFSVQACEKEISLDIAGIQVKVVIDRIDALNDGNLVIIDYKTGNSSDTKSWADDRISEPQLPIYASIALHNEHIVAICFGKVRQDNCLFAGVAEDDNILPQVKSLDSLRANSTFKRFAGWGDLITHWKTSLNAIAQEIKNGEAAVKFKDENALAFCEVKPLLRLPERLLQFEQLQIKIGNEAQ